MNNILSKIWFSIQYSQKLNRDSSGYYLDINDNLLNISKKYNIWCPHKNGYCLSLEGFKFPIFYCPEYEKDNKSANILQFGRADYYGDLFIDDDRYNNTGGIFILTKDEEKILYMSYSIFDRNIVSLPIVSAYIWFSVYDDSIYPNLMYLKEEVPADIAYLNPYEKSLNVYTDYEVYAIDIHRDGCVFLIRDSKFAKEHELSWIG